jgi:hypothetical protein
LRHPVDTVVRRRLIGRRGGRIRLVCFAAWRALPATFLLGFAGRGQPRGHGSGAADGRFAVLWRRLLSGALLVRRRSLESFGAARWLVAVPLSQQVAQRPPL